MMFQRMRQRHRKSCSLPDGALADERSAQFLRNEIVCNVQPKSRAALRLFGGKKGVVNALHNFRWNPAPVVGEAQRYGFRVLFCT